jgi:pimeloyl-ACP methyl ester carboxylesterase
VAGAARRGIATGPADEARVQRWEQTLVVAAVSIYVQFVVHGLGDSIESYLDRALLFRERGHSVLVVDLRGHGGSEGSYTTLGGRERADVRAAREELRRRGLARHGIVLAGHSMGAVAVVLAATGANGLIRAAIVCSPRRPSVPWSDRLCPRTTIRSHPGYRGHAPSSIETSEGQPCAAWRMKSACSSGSSCFMRRRACWRRSSGQSGLSARRRQLQNASAG